MDSYIVIKIENGEKWNKIVKSFNNYDVCYLAEYVKAFQYNQAGNPYLFYYNDGETRAINVIMLNDIANNDYFKGKIEENQYFDATTPYGYGGMLIEGNAYEKVNKEYEKFCQSKNIICEFVRFNLFNKYNEKYNGITENIKHNVVRKIDMTPDQMFMDFEHKVRKNVKKAIANNLKIRIDKNGAHLDEFLTIYYDTMRRNSAESNFYFKENFFNILNEMKENIAYFYVTSDEKVISTELILYTKKVAYSFLGGTLDSYFELRPNDFLKYEIIKWLYENNIEKFVLGGGYGREDDGIFRYKKSFAPNGVVDFFVGKKIFSEEVYNELINIRKKENEKFNENSEYFPLYRS